MKSKAKAKRKIESEVRRMDERVKSAEAIQRLSLRVTFESLATAEKFRQRAIQVLRACESIGRDGFVPAKTERAIDSFRDYVKGLRSFHKPLPARDMRKVRAFLKSPRRH